MTDLLSSQIGNMDVTSASDPDLAEVVNKALDSMDQGRKYGGDHLPLEYRVALLESALLALATALSRRLQL